jgi:hypothetical protein
MTIGSNPSYPTLAEIGADFQSPNQKLIFYKKETQN